MELSPRSQQDPPELEVIGEESTPRSTDQDSEENQCQTSVLREPSVAEKKKCAVKHEDFPHLPGGEEKEKDRDGSSQEKMEVDDTEQCHGPISCVEPSTAPAKQRAAKKKKCTTEHVDVTHLPGGEKDRDGFSQENVEVDSGIVPDKDKDKEDDVDAFQEKMEVGVELSFAPAKNPWDVTHLLGEEKEEEEDRNGFFQEKKEVDHKTSIAQAKQQQQLQLPLQPPASHRQPATTSSQPQSPFSPNISQSTFERRTSSSACTFIALTLGKLFCEACERNSSS